MNNRIGDTRQRAGMPHYKQMLLLLAAIVLALASQPAYADTNARAAAEFALEAAGHAERAARAAEAATRRAREAADGAEATNNYAQTEDGAAAALAGDAVTDAQTAQQQASSATEHAKRAGDRARQAQAAAEKAHASEKRANAPNATAAEKAAAQEAALAAAQEAATAAVRAENSADLGEDARDAADKAADDASDSLRRAKLLTENNTANGVPPAATAPLPINEKDIQEARQLAPSLEFIRSLIGEALNLGLVSEEVTGNRARNDALRDPAEIPIRIAVEEEDPFFLVRGPGGQEVGFPNPTSSLAVPLVSGRVGDTFLIELVAFNENPFDIVVEQVLGNLFGEAILYTPFGGGQLLPTGSSTLLSLGSVTFAEPGAFTAADFRLVADRPGLEETFVANFRAIAEPATLLLLLGALLAAGLSRRATFRGSERTAPSPAIAGSAGTWS